ncbi:MAG TPA: Cof-type HAD-IIB family hydrolase [Candidatus Borkfalkia faecigallinarum]|uniref:Cof-type HAD-IIB family hydrolase n=1 Tax=Candidatus Borkfalkia faecigallinarum TaxID=2838509 RepID=A0A9D2AR49_9FIRM|nr:Cof-type HAD-IIB family hydrolase [Candidatus Borkfalkia faecigallinarum]
MIRLIASDLDGTLLDPAGNLPAGTFPAIEKLYSLGVLFCAASGRQLTALTSMFAPVADKILFMAENGAILAYRGEILRCVTIPQEDVLRALDSIAAIPRALPLLCTADRAYYEETGGGEFLPLVQASYVSNARRPLREIAREEGVCKIAVYDELGPENNAMRALPQALPGLRVIQSGGNWLDISVPDANKGDAMRFLRERFALSREECAAFGDHMNDYEMLLECGHPYVTGNAYPPLKRRIGNAVRSNAENGVVRALQHIADGLLPNGRPMNENTSA